MSKLWGPLGWLTLHSVSLIYPENPSPIEKAIAARYLQLFADTISCHFCKSHFISMHTLYQSSNPDYLDSRQKFAVFVFRAHNTVNKRLDKPRQTTVAECLRALKDATVNTSLGGFRMAYIKYLINNWGREAGGDAMITRGNVKELSKINDEYWTPRDGPIPDLIEEDVMTPIEQTGIRFVNSSRMVSSVVGFKGGKLKLRR